MNLYSSLKVSLRLAESERLHAEASSYCDDHDVPTYGNCLVGERAECLELMGRWDEADALARDLLEMTDISPVNRLHSWLVLGQVRVRRGAPDARETLERGSVLAAGTGEPQWIVPFGLARVEAHWLAGDHEAAVTTVKEGGRLRDRFDPWARGAVAAWERRLGLEPPTEDLPAPYDAVLAGDAALAARRWEALGCPYQAALTLLDGDDEDGWRRALDLLDRLGATASATAARRRLRARGVRVPAGRRAATRSHPAGLTAREDDVLRLLADGLTNDQIAARLVIPQDRRPSRLRGPRQARRGQPPGGRRGAGPPRRWGAGRHNLGRSSRSADRPPTPTFAAVPTHRE